MRTIVFMLSILGLFLLASRAGNAMLVREQAEVLVKEGYCSVVGGDPKGDYCKVVADQSRSFISGDPMLRLRDGSVVTLPSEVVSGIAFTKTHYEFFKTWQ